MDAIQLHHPDGKPSGVYFCQKCRIVHKELARAEQCCMPYKCEDCGAETKRYWLVCDPCRSKRDAAKLQEQIEKAEKLETWDGWVYCEQLQNHNEGYFSDLDELIDYCVEHEDYGDDFDWPEYCFTCTPREPSRPDISDFITGWLDDGYEGMEDHIEGEKELAIALDAFWQLNRKLVSYEPNYKVVVKITRPEIEEAA